MRQGESMTPARQTNAMTLDVEDFFQVAAFEGLIDPQSWDSYPLRVDRNTRRVMALFAERGIKATFFLLGWVAERLPQLVRDIAAEGHELANHGYAHARVNSQSRAAFRSDIRHAKALIEDLSGTAVQGYRAPSYSIDVTTPWAHDEIAEAGHRYSSSVYPVRHDLYGMPDAPRFPYRCASGLTEIPITTLRLGGRNWPIGGGGYFRLLPYLLYRQALLRFNQQEKSPGLFYFHPWEIDPDQPRPAGAGFRSRFRHYLNLERMESRVSQLLEDFHWDRMDRVFLSE